MYMSKVGPNEPNGPYKVGTAPNYAVRITLNKDDISGAFAVAKAYNKKWKVDSYLWSYELSEDDVPHLHGFCVMPEYAKSSMSDWMKKQDVIKKGKNAYMHEPVDDVIKYQAYILKDGEYITNLADDVIQMLLKKVDDVQNNMKLPGFKKLVSICQAKINDHYLKNPNVRIDLSDIAQMIVDIYENDWDKPVPFYKLKEYTMYVANKCNECDAERKLLIKCLF